MAAVVTRPNPLALDTFGAGRYEVAPQLGPGMLSGPYQPGALYLTGQPGGIVTAMGCVISWTDLAGHDRTWSSVTLAAWADGPLSQLGLGQACPWHVSVSRASVGFYSRQKRGDQLVQHGSQPLAARPDEGAIVPVAVAASGNKVAVVVGAQVLTDRRADYGTAERGQWPCWETYITGADQDPRPWVGDPWCISSTNGEDADPAGMYEVLGAVPPSSASALALALDALTEE